VIHHDNRARPRLYSRNEAWDTQAAFFYDRVMAEIQSSHRARGLSRGNVMRAAMELDSQASSRAFAERATEPAARTPSWLGFGALAIVVVVLAAMTALLVDRARAPRAGNHPTAVLLPLPAEIPPVARTPEPNPPSATPRDEAREAADRDLARARDGDPEAQCEVAMRFAEGRGVDKDYKRAAAWFREAAINGVAAAQYDLGLLYDGGLGLERDPIEAVIWYQSAADQNEPIAQLRLGALYLAGDVVPRNPAEAARWLRRAAEQGLAEAQAMLAARYETGDGVAQSMGSAYGWYALAAASGLDEAQLAKARLARSLSLQALSEAEDQAVRLATQVSRHMTAASRQDDNGLLPASSTPAASSGAVSRGMVGELQRLLATGGYDPGPADGFLGEQTSQAIRRYQQDVGLPVDGAAGLALLNRLRAAAAGPPPAAQP
jgi:TPR repeat protein